MNYRQRLRARLRSRGMHVQGRLDRLEARVADLETKPNIFLAPNEWAVRELVEKRVAPKPGPNEQQLQSQLEDYQRRIEKLQETLASLKGNVFPSGKAEELEGRTRKAEARATELEAILEGRTTVIIPAMTENERAQQSSGWIAGYEDAMARATFANSAIKKPKDPEGDLRELLIRALNLEGSASIPKIVDTVQALKSRSSERGKALQQEEEKTRTITDERDALRAENQQLKRLVSNPRNAGIPASRSHEFVIRDDGSVAHIDVIPFGGHASWSLRSAAEILVDQEEAKRGKTTLLEEVTETQIQHAFRAGEPIEVLVRGKVVERIDGLVRVSWAIKRSGDTWFAFPTKEGGVM